ncbi:MAG: histidinol-phosphate transaminase [Bacillota bacterium]|nr:histidinol-phosphate transaminase [Bacillota bacterium]
MSRFLNDRYQSLDAYVPGEQPRVKVLKLNTNESPYPAGPKTVEAVCNATRAEGLNRYCDPDAKALKEALANNYGVKSTNIFTSNGSDDILNFAFMAFADEGVMFPEISYGFYPVFAELHHLDFERVPLCDDWTIDPDDYIARNKMVVIANPNAPTGREMAQADIARICESNPNNLVLIDEAYVDFGAKSAIPLIGRYDNLLVVQTFSKSRSLAGARLGFALGSEAIIADLEKIKFSTNPYNVNTITAAAGVAAIAEQDYYDEKCRLIVEARDYTVDKMKNLGFDVVPSSTNFIFARHETIDGKRLYEILKARNIVIRHFNDEKIAQYNRITIGTLEEMETFIEELTRVVLEETR